MATLRQPAFDSSPIAVRKARPEDAPVCGRICYEAFTKISTEHGFPPDFPSVEVATGVLSMMFTHPGFYCVVAESGGQILGSNCLDERSAIAGVGPITIDPEVQNKGVGRALMEAVLGALGGTRLPGHVAFCRQPFTTGRFLYTPSSGLIRGSRYPRCKVHRSS